MRKLLLILSCAVLALAGGCRREPDPLLGTLEWDRITLPAPAAERIVAMDVREGQQVAAGTRLMQLELVRTRSQLQGLQEQARQREQALQELVAGPRTEQIAQARAQLASARAQARDATAYYARLQPLGRQQLVAAADVDRARAAAGDAQAQVRAAEQALLELERGNRAEDIAQGEAALRAAQADAAVQAVNLEKLDIVAPRAGRVDSLPYKLGDQAPVGASLAVMLVGDAPYARIYVPATLRGRVAIGQALQVSVDGSGQVYRGRIRAIRSEPMFTPYYALSGGDAERLTYLAEVQLPASAKDLPVGVPVRARLADDAHE
ncbi:MAG: HlyD family efflux transporter periplasmic adaptor subunit [Gammaproteobacteria bacterium]|uniref:Membrane protein n=1 Tax=Xanthomonas boreopolis TaxID=86183 RepID=A0A919F5H3_9XANT|nr:HlyD family efflux transporter periplasmic adaptor subunit [Pseudomonas sp. Hp2]GHH48792.1 membrane protein [[Pseudomonas] boreopolis]